MDRLHQLFEQFLRERTYIQYVTPKTLDWYQSAWKAFTASSFKPGVCMDSGRRK